MAVGDMPTFLASNYANNSYSAQQMMGNAAFISNSVASQLYEPEPISPLSAAQGITRFIKSQLEKETKMPNRRIVQVYIADPDSAVPLVDSILYTGEQKMTDLTDQELFFEIDIKGVLEAHNAKRTKMIDKEVKDRTEYLEPAKVRDLKMVVVTVASF